MKRNVYFIIFFLISAVESWAAEVDLSKLANYTKYEAKNGDVITGSTNSCSVIIAAGATVTLKGVNISGYVACIQCKGSATIILADGTENTLESRSSSTPAIMVGDAGTTLTIKGKGILNAKGDNTCAGIGGSRRKACGNITIEDGTINAVGGEWAAGIGCGYDGSCGTITIKGGTITAVGGQMAAGIGVGRGGSCGAVTIAKDVTKVEVYRGKYAPCSCIAAVYDESGTSVTIEDESKVFRYIPKEM